MENEEDKNICEDFKVVIRDIKDEEFEDFQNMLNQELIIDLYSIFKIYEKNGIINYDIYIESMIETFKKYNTSKNFKNIFDLIFNRFQKIKCILKNDKTVFYLTNMIYKNQIETYIIVSFLTILIKCRIFDKIKLLFKLSDTDEDGYLNKTEIKLMITTINFFFCENSEIIFNSTILSQSLMNINVKEKINKLMNEPGNLGIILQKEKYVNFDIFFKCLEKIENYKYEIIPCFINLKKCLYNQRKEKIIEIKNKNKEEFVRASSALASIKPRNRKKLFQRNFSAKLERVIRNVKIKNDKKVDFFSFDNNKKNIKNKQILIGKKERNKSFKELLKYSTILDNEKDEGNDLNIKNKSKNISRNNNSYRESYLFEADFDKIKKLEVEPALVKFSKENIFKLKRYNSNANILSSTIDKNTILKKLRHKNTEELNKDNIKRNIQSTKNINKLKPKNFNSIIKRNSILPLNYKNDIIHNIIQFPSFSSLSKRHNHSLKDFSLSKNSLDKIIEKKENTYNKINNININIFKRPINNFFSPINKSKDKIKLKLTNNFKSLLKGTKTNTNKNKKNNFFKKINNKTFIKSIKNKINNNNKILSRNKNKKSIDYINNKENKYLNNFEILKDIDEEERLALEKSYFSEQELLSLYKNIMKEKNNTKNKFSLFSISDFSLNFFDLNEKLFPNTYGRKINYFQKLKINNNII